MIVLEDSAPKSGVSMVVFPTNSLERTLLSLSSSFRSSRHYPGSVPPAHGFSSGSGGVCVPLVLHRVLHTPLLTKLGSHVSHTTLLCSAASARTLKTRP